MSSSKSVPGAAGEHFLRRLRLLGCRPAALLDYIAVFAILTAAVAPAFYLVFSAWGTRSTTALWERSFIEAIGSSLAAAACVCAGSFAIGFPLGLLSSLYRFPARRALILYQILPLLFPSFLLAIGWSNLRVASALPLPGGKWGTPFVFVFQAVPLVFFTTLAACGALTASQIEVARLHGGERCVLLGAARSAAPPAVLAAFLGGILSLSDPGAPLIFGGRPAAVHVLTSFSALYDFALAAKQCLILAGIVLALVLPSFVFGLPVLAAALLARQVRAPRPLPHRALGLLCCFGLGAVLAAGVLGPSVGLFLPALKNPSFGRALLEVKKTALDTLLYAGGAAFVCSVLALALALVSGRRWGLRLFVMGVLLGTLSLPPALGALGMVQLASNAPPQLDWLTRSRLAVVLVQGLHFLPIGALVMFRAVSSLSPSLSEAAI